MTIDLGYLRSLDRLQLILKKKVHANLHGENAATALGQGLVFQDYKAYVPGDDFRHIDWNVYARTNKFFVKRFEEERNLTVHILVDASASMDYGRKTTKYEYGAMLGLGFAYMALRRNEKFTIATFTDEVRPIRPQKGFNQLVNMVDILTKRKVQGVSGFRAAMEKYKGQLHGRSLMVLVSDFLYDLDEVEEVLRRYRKNEVYVIQVLDPAERELIISGDVLLEDSETRQKMRTYVSRRLKSTYQEKLMGHIMRLRGLCQETDASFISVTSDTQIFEAFYHILR